MRGGTTPHAVFLWICPVREAYRTGEDRKDNACTNSQEMVILGIDVGTIRVGCAVADDSVKIAFPVAVWPRAKNVAEREIIRTIGERGVSLLVVGLPLDPSGLRTAVCDSIEAFVRRIERRIKIEVRYVDEAFSSEQAKERARLSPTPHGEIDAFAACIILDRFFDDLGNVPSN